MNLYRIFVQDRRDLNARANVHHAMRYLVKNDQHLRLKSVDARCLRKGQVKRGGGKPALVMLVEPRPAYGLVPGHDYRLI